MYLPVVRQGRITQGPFVGLTTSPDDILGNSFAQRYTATQNGNTLTATLRSGASGCAKLELVIAQNWVPSTFTCTDANGAWTRFTQKAGTGDALSDDLFSKRNLER